MVSPTLLEELKTIIREDFGKDLKIEVVSEIADSLVGYFDVLARLNFAEIKK